MKLGMQCISGFNLNEKLSAQMESQGLWTAKQHALGREREPGDCIEKWYTLYLLQVVAHKVINKFTLLSDCA